LFPNLLILEVEWSALKREIFEAVRQVVRKARPTCCHKYGLTKAMLPLVVDKHQAHHALLGHPQFIELRSAYEVNGRVKRVVVADADAFGQKQAKIVECLQ
jgi:hypothetical protein